jgi:hypothetical protein
MKTMARRKIRIDDDFDNGKDGKQYKEAELILLFGLTKIVNSPTPLMQEWLDVQPPQFNSGEEYLFNKKFKNLAFNISGWSEEDLKMKLISSVLELGYLDEGNGIVTFFDKTIEATVEGTKLKVKTDFMMAKGLLDVFTTPYFHFQEYKPQKNPTGDSMAQLIEAFLIAQTKNKTNKPIYGVDIVGENWKFVIMEGKEYCVSPTFIATDKEDLLKIIAILRKFRWILENRLMIED